MRYLATVAAALLLAAEAAWAAGGGGESHEPRWSLTLWGFVNFAIYIGILRYFAWPLIKEFLQDRRDRVVDALESAKRAKEEAEHLKAEFERRMQGLAGEAERAREEVLALAQTEAARLVEQAEKTAQRIRQDAQLVADQEVARARRALQEESAELITRLATVLIRQEVRTEDQEQFVREFLTQSREASA